MDDAGQLEAPGNLQLQYAEMLVRVTDAEPSQATNELERGVRISFLCRCASDESAQAQCMWVLSVKDSLPAARLRPGTLLRVFAKPHVYFDDAGDAAILHWQVVFHFPSREEEPSRTFLIAAPSWVARLLAASGVPLMSSCHARLCAKGAAALLN